MQIIYPKDPEQDMGDVWTENYTYLGACCEEKPLEVERYSNGGWEDADRLFHGNGAEDGWYWSVCTKESEWRMGVTDHLHKGDGVTDGR